jgi:hypothetical protein
MSYVALPSPMKLLTNVICVAYTHIINGQAIPEPQIKGRECPSRMIIYEPIDDSLCHKALIVVKIPHNHPFYPHPKPNQNEKDTLLAALDVSRPGVGANELRLG